MGKCPQPVTDSQPVTCPQPVTDSNPGYSFRVISIEDKPKTNTTSQKPDIKPEVTMAGNPSVKVTPITTKKPVKL